MTLTRTAAICLRSPNPGTGREQVSPHSRDKLEEFIGDYNSLFNTKFTTKDSQSVLQLLQRHRQAGEEQGIGSAAGREYVPDGL